MTHLFQQTDPLLTKNQSRLFLGASIQGSCGGLAAEWIYTIRPAGKDSC
jgi:hypothetical protein